jgi:UDP-N-acetylmuramyl pentapeptide phosphotransferase/UDP-N-acetylglucosamine-1-phosphate transferase
MNELPLLGPLASALLTALATFVLLRLRNRLPHAPVNARTLHATPIPRVGGLALWAGFVPVALVSPAVPAMSIAAWGPPFGALLIVSLLDDMRGIAIAPRVAVHVLSAIWFAIAVAAASVTSWALVMLIALIVAWSLNLYNFMDGSDGLAAFMTVAGFGAYGIVLWHADLPATLPLAAAAAAVPVLVVNLPPARLFLGDVGAVPLGFLAAAIGIAGVQDGAWPIWFPLLVFLPFIADASVTLARRVFLGERFWVAHKSHYYQRLHQLGAGHAGTLAVYGGLTTATAGTAVIFAWQKPEWGAPALATWCVAFAVLFAGIDYHWRRNTRTTR